MRQGLQRVAMILTLGGILMVPTTPVATAAELAPSSVFHGQTHSATAGTTTDTIPLDASICSALGLPAGCTVAITTTPGTTSTPTRPSPLSAAGSPSAVALTTQCQWYYGTLDFGWLGITTMVDDIDVYMCWNGATSWRDGLKQTCRVHPPMFYTATITWCDMVDNNTNRTQAGDNWYIQPVLPVGQTYFWARMNFSPNGSYYWTGGQG